MDPYEEPRKALRRIDAQIARLLERRAEIAEEIGQIKRRRGDSVRKPEVERAKLREARARVDFPHAWHAQAILRKAMRYSVAIQRRICGPEA